MILINRIGVPDVPLEVYSFLNFCFHIVFKFLSLQRVKLLLMHLAKAGDDSLPWGVLLTGDQI